MARFTSFQIFTVSSNIICFITLAVLFYVFEKVISPFHRGFFCDDESIQKPYVQNQAVPTAVMAVVSILMVTSVVITCDIFNFLQSQCRNGDVCCDTDTIGVFGCINVKRWIYRIASRLFVTGAGFCMCMILTGIGKRMVGRLRPHFLAVCKPDYARFNCSDGYINFDVCTASKSLKEARLSFPSGHSSAAGFATVFFALYIQYVVQPRKFLLLKPFIQFCAICLGFACIFTRISDYFHHWSDVLAGWILGCILASYTIFVLLNLPASEKKLTQKRNVNNRNATADLESQTGLSLVDNQPATVKLAKD